MLSLANYFSYINNCVNEYKELYKNIQLECQEFCSNIEAQLKKRSTRKRGRKGGGNVTSLQKIDENCQNGERPRRVAAIKAVHLNFELCKTKLKNKLRNEYYSSKRKHRNTKNLQESSTSSQFLKENVADSIESEEKRIKVENDIREVVETNKSIEINSVTKENIDKSPPKHKNIPNGNSKSLVIATENSCRPQKLSYENIKDVIEIQINRSPENEGKEASIGSSGPKEIKQSEENINISNKTDKVQEKKIAEKSTPLQVRNGFATPSSVRSKITISVNKGNKEVSYNDIENLRREYVRKKQLKEEKALKKKQDVMKAKQEELRKKYEEKKLKAAQIRAAAEKEKNEYIARIEKEREEREKIVKAEIEKQKAKKLMKIKRLNHQTGQELERRKFKEEANKIIRLKEIEEEQRKQELQRQKLKVETENLLKQKEKKEELKQKEVQILKENQKKSEKCEQKVKDKEELKDNYDIDDIETDDSTDEDENIPKKEIPDWAKRDVRLKMLQRQVYVPMPLVHSFFQCPSKSPDLTELFGNMTLKRLRTSSAIWLDTPPFKCKNNSTKDFHVLEKSKIVLRDINKSKTILRDKNKKTN